MKQLLRGLAITLVLVSLARAQAASLITNPVVMVTPIVLDFGSVKSNTTATNTLMVENAGGGKLVGKATVAPPFRIISGANYSLKEDTAQLVTVIYTPTTSGTDTLTITFTGGGGAKATVTGKLAGGNSARTR
jgi:hypothetical protein